MKHWIRACIAAVSTVFAAGAPASYHLFQVEQIYSNVDGSVQFIVLHETGGQNGENFLKGKALKVTRAGVTKSFLFPDNLPGGECDFYSCSASPTANARVLIATPGFAALGIVTPDYTLPGPFLPVEGGVINYADVDVVGYAALPTDGVHALSRNGTPIQNVATNFSKSSASVTPGSPAANYTGVWWNSPAGSEGGWGINFAHQGDIAFATWFTYGTDGKPQWYVIRAEKTADRMYAGPVASFTGPPFSSVPFPANANVKTEVGSATITFAADGRSASFAYTVNGIAQTKTIIPQEFAQPVPSCAWGGQADLTLATNYQGLWWVADGQEAGWGINFTHQGNIIFATWFTYDAGGNAWWLVVVATETATPKVYTGALKTATGPPFNAQPFNPDAVIRATIGNATITVVDGNHANLTYAVLIDGVLTQQSKNLTRQVFAAPGTVCR